MLHVTKFFPATYDNPHQKAKLSDRRLTCWLQGLFIYPSVQQDGVALPLRQQRPFAQPTDGDDSDDRRATGIDAFSFTRHTACSFGDAPTGQNAAACLLTVSSTTMMDVRQNGRHISRQRWAGTDDRVPRAIGYYNLPKSCRFRRSAA